MTEKHFIIGLTEEITVSGTTGKITRNSNSTQFIDVELDGWKLNEGEELYIELSHYNDDTELTTNVGPLHLIFNETLGRYVTLAPPELICVAGNWMYSIEQRFNIGETEDGQIEYDSITSAINTLQVTDSIISANQANSFVKETEMLTAVKTIGAAVAVGYNAETVLNAAKLAKTSEINSELNAKLAQESEATSTKAAEEAVAAAAKAAQHEAETKSVAQVISDSMDGTKVYMKDGALVFTDLATNVRMEGSYLIIEGGKI